MIHPFNGFARSFMLLPHSHAWQTRRRAQTLAYFNTIFNTNIAPGDFMWPEENGEGNFSLPQQQQSMQIFDMYMDEYLLESIT